MVATGIFSAILVLVAVAFLVRDYARSRARISGLVGAGFRACTDQTEHLIHIVTTLENSANYRLSLDKPMTADSIDFPFYFYTKLQLQRTRVHAVEECLTTMSRPSEEGVMLLYKTHDNPVTSGKEWGERLYPGVRDWQPQDLTAVNLPPDGERGQLVAGFGPPGASIDDLISKPMWLMLNEVDIYNVSVVVLRGAWCSFSAANSRTCLDVVGFLNLLKKQRQLRFKL